MPKRANQQKPREVPMRVPCERAWRAGDVVSMTNRGTRRRTRPVGSAGGDRRGTAPSRLDPHAGREAEGEQPVGPGACDSARPEARIPGFVERLP